MRYNDKNYNHNLLSNLRPTNLPLDMSKRGKSPVFLDLGAHLYHIRTTFSRMMRDEKPNPYKPAATL